MKRFLAIERSAANEIISGRLFQLAGLSDEETILSLLSDDTDIPKLGSRLQVMKNKDGVFILSRQEVSKDFVIFDLDTCDLFDATSIASESLLFLQKILRFSLKQWSGMRPSGTERILSNSTKAVIFPWPISQKTSFRICVELSPDHDRQVKRPGDGRSFLVYKSGWDQGDGRDEIVSPTNFRRFLEAKKNLSARDLVPAPSGVNPILSLSVTELIRPDRTTHYPSGGYEQWMSLLTPKQEQFVSLPLRAPHRIEGPAGTGKTLSLVLKAIFLLREAVKTGKEQKVLFVTHSEATRRGIEQMFSSYDEHGFMQCDPVKDPQSLTLTTLHRLCGRFLGTEITESELIDRDAMESKQLQVMYVEEAIRGAMESEFPTHRKFMSQHFIDCVEKTDRWALSEMVQHEISVVIKGRAQEQLDSYKILPPLPYGLPVETTADRAFVWQIFVRYQDQLKVSAQFDTDDVVLTTIGQLNTPIWRRRRAREGFDSVLIDETHLFNMNELSLFHHLPRESDRFPIAYSVDRSQAIGDRDWSDARFTESLSPTSKIEEREQHTRMANVFRCSPEIVDLAFSVTSSGATLFTNFENPLEMAASAFTMEDEKKADTPLLIECESDESMIERAFMLSEQLSKEMDVSRGEIAVVAFAQGLFDEAEIFAIKHNKAVEYIKQRGDVEAAQRAEKSGKTILSMPEYVGGLEFAAVILMGVDVGRVPPGGGGGTRDSENFLSYAAHNRLYVAITRARYRVVILTAKERGISALLANAKSSELLRIG